LLRQIGLDHLELEPDAACFAAQQELRVREGKPVRVGVPRVPVVRMGLQFCPGVSQASFGDVVMGFHGDSSGPVQSPMASASGTNTTASALPTMMEAATFSGS